MSNKELCTVIFHNESQYNHLTDAFPRAIHCYRSTLSVCSVMGIGVLNTYFVQKTFSVFPLLLLSSCFKACKHFGFYELLYGVPQGSNPGPVLLSSFVFHSSPKGIIAMCSCLQFPGSRISGRLFALKDGAVYYASTIISTI